MFSIHAFLRDLTRLPHRGAGTPYEAAAVELLVSNLRNLGAETRLEAFRTPATYATIVYWLIGGILTGLLSFPYLGPIAVVLTWTSVVLAWLFFNWRFSPVTQLPPRVRSHNVIGRWHSSESEPVLRLQLMAHYDTAPISLLYSGSQVGNFRLSLVISLVLMVLAAVVVTAELVLPDGFLENLFWVRWALAGYFFTQALLATLGYWLYGYTNGASDNATGVAAALASAERIHQLGLPGLELEVILTGAEEVGMIGAKAYLDRHLHEWPEGRTALINFDTLGNGTLHLIRQTGTVETIRYENELTEQVEALLAAPPFKGQVRTGNWHTADFDSVWWVRAGLPALTLAALDEAGRMPNIHRPEDQLLQTDVTPIQQAVELTVQTAIRYYHSKEAAPRAAFP